MSAHPDLAVLADHLEGLLDPEAADQVRHHLAGCEVCATRVEDLRGVSMLLASQPPPSMPDAVRERIDTALQAEIAPRTGEHPDPAVASVDRARKRRTRASRALLAAAAAVVVVAVGGVVLTDLDAGGPGSGSGGSGQAEPMRAPQSGRAEGVPETVDRPQSPGPLVAPRRQRQPSLIEEIYRTRTVTIQRERASCVAAAVDDPRWVGTSYAVQTKDGPAVVAFLGDADNTARTTTGVLIECAAEPRVLRRQQLRR